MNRSILVPTQETALVKRLARLAEKAGLQFETQAGSTIVYRRVAERVQTSAGSYKRHVVDPTRAIECARITIGDLPRLNGYTLIGKVVHTPAGNLINMAPAGQSGDIDAITTEAWRNAPNTCDHCKTSRRRTDTFLVRSPDGITVRRIGRNCLADFLATDPAAWIASQAFEDSLRELTESDESDGDNLAGGGGCWSKSTTTTWHYLACANSSTRRHGFVSTKSEGRNAPTKQTAAFYAGPCPTLTRDNYDLVQDWKDGQPTEADLVELVGLYVWLQDTQDRGVNTDYMHNARVAASNMVIAESTMGILASLPSAYQREQGKQSQRQLAANLSKQATEGHVNATVGQRIDAEVTIVKAFVYETPMSCFASSKLLVTMVTDAGHMLVTHTLGDGPCPGGHYSQAVGKRFSIRGTVKKLDTYQGQAQTVLSRVAFTKKDEK